MIDILARVRSRTSFSTPGSVAKVAILGIWLTVVLIAASRHEFWRDEVRALSLIRPAVSPLDLYGLTQYEGHPVLWYLILYVGKSIVDTPLVLPVASIVIAFAAVAVLVFASPFPMWMRCLFAFSALPLYEYSVMARNYGISMLLFFVAAMLYRHRATRPYALAFVLALLANTNAHSVVLVCLVSAAWAWDMVTEARTVSLSDRRYTRYLPFVVIAAGVLLSAVFAMPRESTIMLPARNPGSIHDLAQALAAAVLRPSETFPDIVPLGLSPAFCTLVLYAAVFGLLYRPNLFLAALGGQIGLGMLFRVVHAGSYRHQGLFLVFMLFLYWLFLDSLNGKSLTRVKRLLFNAGLYGALLMLVLTNVVKTKNAMWTDLRSEMTSNKAFGAFLNESDLYHNAIIVPEPDYLLESLPYYAGNRIYLPRERRFGTTVSWTTQARPRLTLGELLSTARDIRVRYGQPVLIVFGHWDLDKYPSGEKRYSFNKVFSRDANETAEFDESTRLVREFSKASTDENYRVYALK